MTQVLVYLGWVDPDLVSSPGLWADTVATRCQSIPNFQIKVNSSKVHNHQSDPVLLYEIRDIIKIPERRFFVELEALSLPSGREAVVGSPEHRRLKTSTQLLVREKGSKLSHSNS